MADKLKDRVIIVTGAGTGIGRAISVVYTKEGANVIGTGRRLEKLQETSKLTEPLPGKFTAMQCDVSVKADCEKVAQETINKFGRIDVLVNNAAVYYFKRFLSLAPEDWDTVFATNVRGVAQMCQAVLPSMVKQKSGNIIMVNSAESFNPTYLQPHYSSTKGALLTLAKCLASEFGKQGIRVNSFAPGPTVETDQVDRSTRELPPGFFETTVKNTPLRRIATPEDYKGVALFLASDDSAFMTGQLITVDGGLSM